MKHRIFRLDIQVKRLGLEIPELGIIGLILFSTLGTIPKKIPGFPGLILAFGIPLVIGYFMRSLKDHMPTSMWSQIFFWISQPAIYKPKRDLIQVPLLPHQEHTDDDSN
jgi:hypothetical protein